MQTRNYIIIKYSILRQQNPSARITATEVRHSLAGDVCGLLHIHEFIETFGIINCDPSSVESLDKKVVPAFYAPVPLETWENKNCSSAITSSSSCCSKDESESALEEGQEVSNKLLRSTVQHSCDWESIAKDVGNGVSPMECEQTFMRLSVEEILAPDPACTGLMHSQQQNVCPSLLSATMGTENPLSTRRYQG